jgi:hypothetical protein
MSAGVLLTCIALGLVIVPLAPQTARAADKPPPVKGNLHAALSRLAAPSRDAVSSSQWDTQYCGPDGQTIVNAQVVLQGTSGYYALADGTILGDLSNITTSTDTQSPVQPGCGPAQVLDGAWSFRSTGETGTFDWHVNSCGTQFQGTWQSDTSGASGWWNGTRSDNGAGSNPDNGGYPPNNGGYPSGGGSVSPPYTPAPPPYTPAPVPAPLPHRWHPQPHPQWHPQPQHHPQTTTRPHYFPRHPGLRFPSRDLDLNKLQAATRGIGGELGKLGGEASDLTKQGEAGAAQLGGEVSGLVKQGEAAAAQLDPTAALRNELASARSAAMSKLPRLSPEVIFGWVQGSLQQRIVDELRKMGALYDASTGNFDLRPTRAGQFLAQCAYGFAQGNKRQGGAEEFTYNVPNELLTLRLYAVHCQSWGKVIPGTGPVDLYSVTQRAAFWYNFRTGSGGFDIDLGPLAPRMTTRTAEKLEAGDLIGAAEAAAPGEAGKLAPLETQDNYDQLVRQYQAHYGAGNVYFASRDFVNNVSPDTAARYVANGIITLGASVYPEIMHDVANLAQQELPRVAEFLKAHEMREAETAARRLLSGQPPLQSWPVTFELIPVQYASRNRVLGRVNTPWRRENHLAFVIIWDDHGNQMNLVGSGEAHAGTAAERQRELAAERQRELTAERQREAAVERQRELAAERRREAAAERQRELTAERRREAAVKRQHELAAERQRASQEERQRGAAAQHKRLHEWLPQPPQRPGFWK